MFHWIILVLGSLTFAAVCLYIGLRVLYVILSLLPPSIGDFIYNVLEILVMIVTLILGLPYLIVSVIVEYCVEQVSSKRKKE